MASTNFCFICTKKQVNGIKINDRIICSNCEDRLVKTLPIDPQYDDYLHRIKTLLFDEINYN
ncbi:MAG: hypothetical protein AWU54_117 [Candidatus Frackibacter sp. T328-2]|nr:MAG: hypothetical protein AWU54_117 [Candidatus Frackibacter sp. T328-2]